MRSIKTSVNLYRILGFTFRNIRQTIAYSTDSRTSKLPKSRCWGGARSMTGGAGQLIVNMTKTGCYYYYFYILIYYDFNNKITIQAHFKCL